MTTIGKEEEHDERDKEVVIIDVPESQIAVADEAHRTRQLGNALTPEEVSNKVTNGLVKKDILILAVDDHAESVALMSFDLQKQGYRVVTASNGIEAIQVATLMKPNLILMDIGMPELDGLAATTKIREDESLRAVPVVATTAFTTAGFRRAAYDVGFDGYVTKPIDFQQLHELIIRLLSKAEEEKAQGKTSEQ